MIALLALAAVVSSPSVIDAERAFAAKARRNGQWTAFRATAAPDALMFVPGATSARKWLKGRKNPPKSVRWQPAAAFLSCDGRLAATTGPWQRPESVGYFTTIWRRVPGGSWKWLLDHGDTLKTAWAAPARPKLRRASCAISKGARGPYMKADGAGAGSGASPDHSLTYSWQVEPSGARHVGVALWTGAGYTTVIDNRVAADQ